MNIKFIWGKKPYIIDDKIDECNCEYEKVRIDVIDDYDPSILDYILNKLGYNKTKTF